MRYLIAIVLSFASAANALPIGKCFPTEAAAKSAIFADGQKIAASSGDRKVIFSHGNGGNGNVLQADAGTDFCVVSELTKVAAPNRPRAINACMDPAKFPGAIKTCDAMKAEGIKVTRILVAQSLQAMLAAKPAGPVEVSFMLCKDSSGKEYLCGRTETSKNQ